MLTIRKIGEHNRQPFLEAIRHDVVRHVFAFYDLQYEVEHTTVHAAYEGNTLKGYILVYTALDYASVILEADPETAPSLLSLALPDRFIMHAATELLPVIKTKFPEAKHYVEDWMLVRARDMSRPKAKHCRRRRHACRVTLYAQRSQTQRSRTVQGMGDHAAYLRHFRRRPARVLRK